MAKEAPACKKALQDATARWPNRNRASDGIMGDRAHMQRHSDHNLGLAYDLTHDPQNGVDCSKLCLEVIKDPRVTYVIFNKKIYNRKRASEGWRDYHGINPHQKHMHVSIKEASRNDLSPWPWSVKGPTEAEMDTLLSMPLLKLDSPMMKGESVKSLQRRLNAHGCEVEIDGTFGERTQDAVKIFQKVRGLTDDGIVGPLTWKKLMEK